MQAAGWRICLVRHGGDVHAVRDECPHRSGSLGHGGLRDGLLTCPVHGWGFDLSTGTSPDHPEARLRRYPVRVADGRILVTLPS